MLFHTTDGHNTNFSPSRSKPLRKNTSTNWDSEAGWLVTRRISIRLRGRRNAGSCNQVLKAKEVDLRKHVKAAGEKWHPGKQVWQLAYKKILNWEFCGLTMTCTFGLIISIFSNMKIRSP